MSSNKANRKALQRVHTAVESESAFNTSVTVPASLHEDGEIDPGSSSQGDQAMQDIDQSAGCTDEEELDEGLWDDLYADEV